MKTKISSYVVIEQGKTENYEVFRVFRLKIAREFHGLVHRNYENENFKGENCEVIFMLLPEIRPCWSKHFHLFQTADHFSVYKPAKPYDHFVP